MIMQKFGRKNATLNDCNVLQCIAAVGVMANVWSQMVRKRPKLVCRNKALHRGLLIQAAPRGIDLESWSSSTFIDWKSFNHIGQFLKVGVLLSDWLCFGVRHVETLKVSPCLKSHWGTAKLCERRSLKSVDLLGSNLSWTSQNLDRTNNNWKCYQQKSGVSSVKLRVLGQKFKIVSLKCSTAKETYAVVPENFFWTCCMFLFLVSHHN